MNKIGFGLIIALMLGAIAFVQTPQTPEGKKSAEILDNARRLDLLNHMLPLLLTKKQINDILVPVEKARAKVKQIISMEAADIRKVEPEINEALQNGYTKGAIPPKDTLRKVNQLIIALTIRRDVAANENVDEVVAVIDKSWNNGQKKTAINSLDVKYYFPNADPAKVTDEQRMRMFIKDILLDPLGYDVLVQLSKIAA